MFILVNVVMTVSVIITYILLVDIALWLVFHAVLDVILHNRQKKGKFQ